MITAIAAAVSDHAGMVGNSKIADS